MLWKAEQAIQAIRNLIHKHRIRPPLHVSDSLLRPIALKMKNKLACLDTKNRSDAYTAIKAYGCEFDNYLTVESKEELKTQLELHRRDHDVFWSTRMSGRPYVCHPGQGTLVLPSSMDDDEYDRQAICFVSRIDRILQSIAIELEYDIVVYHGLIGYRSRCPRSFRYLSTSLYAWTAANFAENEDLAPPVHDSERSHMPMVARFTIPRGTRVFTTDICYCVQPEEEIVVVSSGTIVIKCELLARRKTIYSDTGVPRDFLQYDAMLAFE